MIALLHTFFEQNSIPVSDMGVIGDMFGGATALFSGLAFVGLIVVLLYDMRERERDLTDRVEARRPVLTVRFGGESESLVTVARAVPEAGRTADLRLEMSVSLECLADVAISPSLMARLTDGDGDTWTGREQLGLPISAGEVRQVEFVAQFVGRPAYALLEKLRTGDLYASFDAQYRSVSGAHWRTEVQAELRISPEDMGFAQQVLEGTGVVDRANTASVANSLKTDLTVDPASWLHERAHPS